MPEQQPLAGLINCFPGFPDRQRLLVSASIAVAGIIWLVWVVWLFQYPLQLSSDDALFFSRGVERFSVLELRPHFPGYPVFVALAGVISLGFAADTAVILTSLLSAVVLPWILLLLLREVSPESYRSPLATIVLMLLCALQPLLAALALSGLSDATGLLFAALALLLTWRRQFLTAGICCGLMLASRPSYFPLAAGLIAIIPLLYKQQFLSVWLRGASGVVLVGIPVMLFLLSRDGLAFFEEGLRFTQGHFQIWGNTFEGQRPNWQEWLERLTDVYCWSVLCLLAASLLWGLKQSSQRPLAVVITLYLGWILLAQNPDNMRHFAPVMLLWLPLLVSQMLCLSVIVYRLSCALSIAIGAVLFFSQASLTVSSAPVQQAVQWLDRAACTDGDDGRTGLTLGTNYSVSLLREALPGCQIFDMYYPSSKALVRQAGGFRLSGSPQQDMLLITVFPARFPGERTLYLYRFSESG
ncbi:hypothetical protein [Spongorhabdus nitratireducens]